MLTVEFLSARLTEIENEYAQKKVELEKIKLVPGNIDAIRKNLDIHRENRVAFNEELPALLPALQQHMNKNEYPRLQDLRAYQSQQLSDPILKNAFNYYINMIETFGGETDSIKFQNQFKPKLGTIKEELENHLENVTDKQPCNTVYGILNSCYVYLQQYSECQDSIKNNETYIQHATQTIEYLTTQYHLRLEETNVAIKHYEIEIAEIKEELAKLSAGDELVAPKYIDLINNASNTHDTTSSKKEAKEFEMTTFGLD